jgi:hypothetical protein
MVHEFEALRAGPCWTPEDETEWKGLWLEEHWARRRRNLLTLRTLGDAVVEGLVATDVRVPSAG